jgi:phage terminase large subunit-like protein
LSKHDQAELLKLLEEKENRKRFNKIKTYYPDKGRLNRTLYPKHMNFFEAGSVKRERLFMAANRIGKTEGAGGYEMALHLTGDYPTWWKGRRFDKPISAWAAGDTGKTVREIIQQKLLGPLHDIGTGLIPKDKIIKYTAKQGVSEAIDTVTIKHSSGGISQLVLKSYDQKRISFQGSEQDLLWFDEEPPLEIYTEGLLRTMTNNGLIMLTFTPLMGMSEVVMSFLPSGQIVDVSEGPKFVVTATWDDVPHLSTEAKEQLWNSIPPFQRDARSKGIPQLGAGAIFPVPESDFAVQDFAIPDHWPRCYGLDIGWNRTAAVFAAIDRDNDIVYLISEHYRGQAEPSIHAEAIKARGAWIPGVIDPASRGRTQRDGQQIIQDYIDLGLDLDVAFNGVESGLYEVWQRLSTGRLKVFKSLSNWFYEFRLYRRDESGRIVKENDHLMDALRYLCMSALARAKTKPSDQPQSSVENYYSPGGWMG